MATHTTEVASSSQSKGAVLSSMWWHRTGAHGGAVGDQGVGFLMEMLWRGGLGQSSVWQTGWGCQVSPFSRAQMLPCSVGWITSGFLSFPAFPMGFSVGRYDLLHTISCQPCDSYIVPGLVCLQVRIFKLNLFLTEDCLGVTMRTEVPFLEDYFGNVCVCRVRMLYVM